MKIGIGTTVWQAGPTSGWGGKSNAEDYKFLREMRRERDFFADRLIAFIRFFVPCAKLSRRFSRELFENAIELR